MKIDNKNYNKKYDPLFQQAIKTFYSWKNKLQPQWNTFIKQQKKLQKDWINNQLKKSKTKTK